MEFQEILVFGIGIIAVVFIFRNTIRQVVRKKSGCDKCTCCESDETESQIK